MRTDIHNHAIPRRAIELLNQDPVYGVTVEGSVWRGGVHVDFEVVPSFVDPDAKVAELQANELDAAIVSVAPPLFYHHVDAEPAEAMAVAVNEGLAEMAAAHPDRLRWMASVPLQAPERAVAVLEASEAAGAVGVEIGTSVGTQTALDDPGLEVFWEAAARLRLPVMIHPAYAHPHPRMKSFYLTNAIGFLLETTIAIERLICAGVLDRHPELRLVLVHAGGFFPWQAGRLRHARTVRPELADSPADPWAYFGQIVLDPITHDLDALRHLVAKVGPEHIALGTDLPFDMAPPAPMRALIEATGEATAALIAEENPLRLFPVERVPA